MTDGRDQSACRIDLSNEGEDRRVTPELVWGPAARRQHASQSGWINGGDRELDRGRVAVLALERLALDSDERCVEAGGLQAKLRIPDLEVLVLWTDENRD